VAYLSTGWIIFYIFAAIWLGGWAASINETSVGQETKPLKKIGGIILLFFIWPYIAICMMGQGDI
jgi:hypothetical protein